MILMNELPADDTHDVIRHDGEVVAVVVPIGEYRRLREAIEEQRASSATIFPVSPRSGRVSVSSPMSRGHGSRSLMG
jgi:hypothetical protein